MRDEFPAALGGFVVGVLLGAAIAWVVATDTVRGDLCRERGGVYTSHGCYRADAKVKEP